MSPRHSFRTAILLIGFAALFTPIPVCAWGCKGHQTIALIAEKHLTPQAKEFSENLLRENPVDPQSSQYCGAPQQDLLAAASTWADDIRRQRPDTAPWHYINIPLGTPRQSLQQYCGDRGCISRAVAEQLAILKDGNAESAKRAEALRFLIHFIGDLHMPLHASNNNDLGGNCVPVKYFRRRPHEYHDTFSPNLHSLWDVAVLERDMGGAQPAEYARYLNKLFDSRLDDWRGAGIHIDDWVWESHDLADSIAYAGLLPKVSIESPVPMQNCADANHIGERMLALNISAADSYQAAAAPVIQERLAQAGVRLAMLLNDAASSMSHR